MPRYTQNTPRNPATHSKLPQRTLDYLAHGAAKGNRNPELFAAAQQFRDAGYTQAEAEPRLIGRGMADGLSEAECRKAINSAYGEPSRQPAGAPVSGNGSVPHQQPHQAASGSTKAAGGSAGPAAGQAAGPAAAATSAARTLPYPIPGGLSVLLGVCFLPGEVVSLSETFLDPGGLRRPGGGDTYTVEQLQRQLGTRSIDQMYPDPDGLYIRINPMHAGGKTDNDVTSFRHVLVEFDLDENGNRIPKISQYCALIDSGLPISVILDSGDKSIHGWVRVDAATIEEFKARREIVWDKFAAWDLDVKNKNPSRYSRCPGVPRNLYDDQGNQYGVGRQELLATNVGPASWTEYERTNTQAKTYIEFLKPSEIKAYQPPPGILLVGQNHIVRGNVFLIGGPPGVGKSRATVALGEAGATGLDWFGLPVHCRFKTLIIQNENGRYRLSQEFANLDALLLDQYLRVTPPPPYGLCFSKAEFRDQLKAEIDSDMPGVALLDPWNAVSHDDKQRDYLEGFDLIRSVFPPGDQGPAIGIVAHTRKPNQGDHKNGRALLTLLAGSYVLTSVPRTVWVLQPASDDVLDNRVVVTCCKNSDGELGDRSVWVRDNGQWQASPGFDWDEWDNADSKGNSGRGSITEQAMRTVFDNGQKQLTAAEAVQALEDLTGLKKTACYKALKLTGGKFSRHLSYDRKRKLFSWQN